MRRGGRQRCPRMDSSLRFVLTLQLWRPLAQVVPIHSFIRGANLFSSPCRCRKHYGARSWHRTILCEPATFSSCYDSSVLLHFGHFEQGKEGSSARQLFCPKDITLVASNRHCSRYFFVPRSRRRRTITSTQAHHLIRCTARYTSSWSNLNASFSSQVIPKIHHADWHLAAASFIRLQRCSRKRWRRLRCLLDLRSMLPAQFPPSPPWVRSSLIAMEINST